MTNPKSVLFMNIDQSKNKFSELPKTSTTYIIDYRHNQNNGPYYIVIISSYEKKDRILYNVSLKKVELIREFTTHVPGSGYRMRAKPRKFTDDPFEYLLRGGYNALKDK